MASGGRIARLSAQMHFNAEEISASKLVSMQRDVGFILNAINAVHVLTIDRIEVSVCRA